MQRSPAHPALARAIAATLPPIPPLAFTIPPAQPDATPRHTAPQNGPPAQIEPTPNHGPLTINHRQTTPSRPKPLKPIQLTAARLLLLGHPVSVVAQTLRINRYTITRWKQDPRFRAELDRQLAVHLALDHDDESATPRHKAPQKAAFPAPRRKTNPPTTRPVHGQ